MSPIARFCKAVFEFFENNPDVTPVSDTLEMYDEDGELCGVCGHGAALLSIPEETPGYVGKDNRYWSSYKLSANHYGVTESFVSAFEDGWDDNPTNAYCRSPGYRVGKRLRPAVEKRREKVRNLP